MSTYDIQRDGVQCFPLYDNIQLADLRTKFVDTILAFPEFEKIGNPFIVSSASLFGNPGSYHNPLVRQIRKDSYNLLRPIFASLFPNKNIEMICGNMMFRCVGITPQRIQWFKNGDDSTIYDGWINLDEVEEIFSCVLTSHNKEIPVEQRTRCRVKVPAGNIVIYNHTLLHEISASKKKYNIHRLYISWRIFDSTTPLIKDVKLRLNDQAVMPQSDKYLPSMYSRNHLKFHRRMIIQFSRQLKRETLEEDEFGNMIVRRHMLSLCEYGFPLYPPYTEDEMLMYIPQSLN